MNRANRPAGNTSAEAIRDFKTSPTPTPQPEVGPLDGVSAPPVVDKPAADAPVPGTVPNPAAAPPDGAPMNNPRSGPVRLAAGDASSFKIDPPAQASPNMMVKVDYRPALLNDNTTQQKIVLNRNEQPVGSVGRGEVQSETLDGELFLPRQKKDRSYAQPMAMFVTFDNEGKVSGRYMFDITVDSSELVPMDDAMPVSYTHLRAHET